MSGTRDRHYTPDAVVDRLVELTLAPLVARGGEMAVLDPACGDGAFLRGALRFLTRALDRPAEQVAKMLHGIDIDPVAVEAARESLVQVAGHPGHIVHGDALLEPGLPPPAGNEPWCPLVPWEIFPRVFTRARPGFDAVIGNPPYVDAEHMVKLRPHRRALLRERYRTARGNWDLFCPFIERALALCREGGRVSLLVPGQLASAEYAMQARDLLTTACSLEHLVDYGQARLFDAHVYPLAYVATRGGAPREVCIERYDADLRRSEQLVSPHHAFTAAPWPLHGSDDLPFPALGTLAEVSGAATVAEAYDLVPHLRDDPAPGPGDARVINSGTIDAFRALWGERPMRYLKQRWSHPVLPAAAQAHLSPRRRAQLQSPKVVVAGMTRRLEACVDPDGAWLAAKSTTVVIPHAMDPWVLAALLNSAAGSALYAQRYAGLRLAGGYLRVGPPQLRALPIPEPSSSQAAELAEAARRAAQQDDAARARIDAIASALYQP